MIKKEDIDRAYDDLEAAFKELAEAEDCMSRIAAELTDYKEGSKAALAVQERLNKMQPKATELQRKYRLAGMRVGRLGACLEVELIARRR
jgi:hypothetical protein